MASNYEALPTCGSTSWLFASVSTSLLSVLGPTRLELLNVSGIFFRKTFNQLIFQTFFRCFSSPFSFLKLKYFHLNLNVLDGHLFYYYYLFLVTNR